MINTKKIHNYDELLEMCKDVDVKKIKKVMDQVDDKTIKEIYEHDLWIMEESNVVTGSLSSIAKERIRQLLVEDLRKVS
ncbi:MAG: hypothetical protein ACOCRO_04080 [Halanaerobiales bacterium]